MSLVMVKYVSYDVVFQEIPDEVTLAISLSNCPNACKGCHSSHLMGDVGEELSKEVLAELLKSYGSAITCVCFMGGDAAPSEIESLIRYVKTNYSLKTAWYSGRERFPDDMSNFDYIKLGPYVDSLGGLKSIKTNQRLYKLSDGVCKDITHMFWQ